VSTRSKRSDTGRFVVVLATLLVLLAVVALRLVWLQVVAAPAYAEKAEKQRLRDITIPARRGTIYDRDGEPLAMTVDAKTVYGTPFQVKDKVGTATAIAGVLGGDPAEYQAKLSRKSGFVYIARKVDARVAADLEALELEGIGFLDDSKRVYPGGSLACQILGFVGIDDQGLAGIEAEYDSLLSGKPGILLAERDPFGRPIPGGVIRSEDAVAGDGLVLTIDKDIQYQTQLELAAAVKKWNAKSGSVIVMDPQTGEIYAMASTPYFDPNEYGKAPAAATRNKAACDTYEPGSTMKSLTAASVLDKGLFTPESKLVLPPTLKVAGRTIHESHPRGTVEWTLTEIVTHSSNVGAVRLGQALGPQGLYDYFSKFGLLERTGLDFPGEGRGWMPAPGQWSATSMANIPFGQGVSVTPIQLCRAFTALANQGEIVTPHFLKSLPDDPGAEPQWETRRAISQSAAASATQVLSAVVTDGTGKAAAVSGFTVAGKTGTAQKAENGSYAAGKYVGSFIGYLPAEDPRLLIIVSLDEPRNAIYGGTIAAPTFSALARFSVSHLKILPPPASESTPTADTSVTTSP